MKKTIIIAEAGVNHNGDIQIAKRLIDVAAEAGVDYVKFQTFKTKNLVSQKAAMASYQEANLGSKSSQFEMIKKLELDIEAHHILKEYCAIKKVNFLSTAFDLDSIDLLEKIGIDFYKIPSGEITNKPYLEKIASKGKPIVMSTGMCDMEDIRKAFNTLCDHGANRSTITILHCNTQYPTPLSDVNLNAMDTIREEFGVDIGYSDHTLGIEVSLAAVAKGAKILEKHFTLDRKMKGPDHKASLEPSELKQLVILTRNIDIALGSKEKKPSPSESQNIPIARKSVHLSVALKKGTSLTKDHFAMKRPGHGISPMEYEKLIGEVINKDLPSDHLLTYDDLIK